METNSQDELAVGEMDWIVGQLSQMIHRHGADIFVSGPLIMATPEYFPDLWSNDAEGVALVARRCLALAGIDQPHVHIIDHTPLAAESTVEVPELQFLGLTEQSGFEIDLTSAGVPADLLGVLSHEVGLAYLAAQQQQLGDGPFRGTAPPEEDPVVLQARGSIASVYLGFGLPATNAAHQAHHGGYVQGSYHVTEWAITTAGGLSVSAIEFLLALQLVVRSRSQEVALARKHLGPNQRVAVDRWIEELTPDRGEWINRLKLPEPSAWPEPTSAQMSGEPPGSHTVEVPVDADEVARFNEGQPVFSVVSRRTTSYAVLGLVVGTIVGVLIALVAAPIALAFTAGGGLVIGFARGRSTRVFHCSDGGCQRALPAGASKCGYCGGKIVGELQNANERLAALEELEEREEQD